MSDELLMLGTRSALFVVAISMLFGATAGYAIASRAALSTLGGALIGALTGLPGVAIYGIVAAAVLHSRKRGTPPRAAELRRSVARGNLGSEPAAGAAASSPPPAVWGDSESLWGADGTAEFVPARRGPGDFADGSYADDEVLTGWTSEPAGPAVTAVDAQASLAHVPAGKGGLRAAWRRSPRARVLIGALAAAAAIAFASSQLRWFGIDVGDYWSGRIYAYDGPLGTAVYTTVALLIAGALALVWKPSRIAAVLLAFLADSWLVALVLAASTVHTARELVRDANNGAHSIADALELLGIDTDAEHLTLPSWLGGGSAPVPDTDLTQAVPDVLLGVGPGLWAIVVAAILAHVVAIVVLLAADRMSREGLSRVEPHPAS
ncbi:hypothetical protein [Demequina rhizosphaerae]|uniref:hypothetical protein n=1 Tax=Demequina rhizosphaerae TaxID=1638985 RepID=UPI0007834214|nr:hypothetical protein [Demequina rhizosphaerae]